MSKTTGTSNYLNPHSLFRSICNVLRDWIRHFYCAMRWVLRHRRVVDREVLFNGTTRERLSARRCGSSGYALAVNASNGFSSDSCGVGSAE